MTTADEEAGLHLEVALALWPLIGPCVRVEGGNVLRRLANRLDDAQDRRVLVGEVARRWSSLTVEQQRSYSEDRVRAMAEFAADYVDDVEQSAHDGDDYRTGDFDADLEAVWRDHVAAIRGRTAIIRNIANP